MFYYESIGDVISQVYKIEANTWEEAKKEAWEWLSKGDVLAECEADAIEETYNGEYHSIDEAKCKKYATLECGVWVNTKGGEDFREDIWYFSDDDEEYLDKDGNPYDFSQIDGIDEY